MPMRARMAAGGQFLGEGPDRGGRVLAVLADIGVDVGILCCIQLGGVEDRGAGLDLPEGHACHTARSLLLAGRAETIHCVSPRSE